MKLLKLVTTMLGVAILLANTGDCVNLAFAESKAAECCLMKDCPLAAAGQMDSCCANPVSPAKYIQRTDQTSLSQPDVTHVEFPLEAFSTAQILRIVGHSSVNL